MALTWEAPDWDDDNWRERASCRSLAPDLFFPLGTTGSAVAQIAAAKVVCAKCPVRSACLEFSFVTNQEAGVWGGHTEEERRRMRAAWRASRRPVALKA